MWIESAFSSLMGIMTQFLDRMGIQNLEKKEKKEKEKKERNCKSYITAPKGLFQWVVGVTWETSYTYIYVHMYWYKTPTPLVPIRWIRRLTGPHVIVVVVQWKYSLRGWELKKLYHFISEQCAGDCSPASIVQIDFIQFKTITMLIVYNVLEIVLTQDSHACLMIFLSFSFRSFAASTHDNRTLSFLSW